MARKADNRVQRVNKDLALTTYLEHDLHNLY